MSHYDGRAPLVQRGSLILAEVIEQGCRLLALFGRDRRVANVCC